MDEIFIDPLRQEGGGGSDQGPCFPGAHFLSGSKGRMTLRA